MALELPEPIGKQWEWMEADSGRKLYRVGRRGSKTRHFFLASLIGHGPGWREGKPKYPGVMQGKPDRLCDVVWCSKTYSNLSTVLWNEEVVPRFTNFPGITLQTAPTRDVIVQGRGRLMLRSADREAIDSIRGIGKNLVGVILDEAAFFDLRGALRSVILPALLDNGGWLMVGSTTNKGHDGGYKEDESRQIPSYFNQLAMEIRSGQQPGWVEFTGTAFDNPAMDPARIRALIAEFEPDSVELKQEIFAELLTSGAGLAFTQLSDRHWVSPHEVPERATWFAGFDWGYNHPWAMPYGFRTSDGSVEVVDTLWGRHDEPDGIAEKVRKGLNGRAVQTIWSSPDAWAEKGRAIGAGEVTIGYYLQASGLPFVKAPTDTKDTNVSGFDNLRRYLNWQKTEILPERVPLLRFWKTPGNQRLVSQLAAMQLDPRHEENVLKVDAIEGRGGDDGYEALRRMLQAYPIYPTKRKAEPGSKRPDRAMPLRVEGGRAVPALPDPTTVEDVMHQYVSQRHGRPERRFPHEKSRLPRNR